MTSFLKFILIICSSKLIFAASDYKISNFTCNSRIKSGIVVEICEFTDHIMSVSINVSEPLSKIVVSLLILLLQLMQFFLFVTIFQAQTDFFFLTNGKFKPMFKSPPVDWCSLVGGGSSTAKVNSFVKMFIDTIKIAVPQFIHKCPYTGFYGAKNISLMRHFITFCPNGSFKLKSSMSDGANEVMKFVLLYTMF